MRDDIIQKAISKFYEIRDIPYHISVSDQEEYNDCEGKNKKLAKALEDLGYKVRFRVGLFYWNVVKLPKEILEIPHNEDCSHFFIEVTLPDKNEWVFVDATWNKELKNAGFIVAEWDGVNQTELAFECYEVLGSEDLRRYLENINYEKDLKTNGKFYEAINKYCDSFLKPHKNE